jgi:Holliday junction resolvasome RuvABC endonuclease subunit
MLLCLDVAFSHLGWSLFGASQPKECGVIEAEVDGGKKRLVSDVRADRCASMVKQLLDIVELNKTRGTPIRGVIGELPSGSQNAAAANQLGIASGLVVTFCLLKDLPAEWVSQNDVKRAVTGKLSATKEEIMDRVAEHYGWVKEEKVIAIGKGKRAGQTSTQATYCALGQRFPKSTFEHIADSIGVYWASRHRNLVRMWG